MRQIFEAMMSTLPPASGAEAGAQSAHRDHSFRVIVIALGVSKRVATFWISGWGLLVGPSTWLSPMGSRGTSDQGAGLSVFRRELLDDSAPPSLFDTLEA